MDTFKYIAFLRGFDDQKITNYFICSSFFFFLGQVIDVAFYQKFQIEKTLKFQFAMNLALSLLILASSLYHPLFLQAILIGRFLIAQIYTNHDLVCHDLLRDASYHKWMQTSMFVSSLIECGVIKFFLQEDQLCAAPLFYFITGVCSGLVFLLF